VNIGSVHIPTVVAAVLLIIGIWVVLKFVLKKFV